MDNISKELDISGNICGISDKYFELLSKYEKLYAKDFDSKHVENRDNKRNTKDIQKEKTDFNNNKPNMLAFLEQLSKLDLKITQVDFVATSLYPSAMWDKISVYLKTETRFAFESHLRDDYV